MDRNSDFNLSFETRRFYILKKAEYLLNPEAMIEGLAFDLPGDFYSDAEIEAYFAKRAIYANWLREGKEKGFDVFETNLFVA